MARKFLYVIAGLVVLAIAGGVVYNIWGQQLIQIAMVPRSAFTPIAPLPANAYADKTMWLSRPDMAGDNPSHWLPDGYRDPAPASEKAAIFFVHPTSFITVGDAKWNMPLDDKDALATAQRFVRAQASAFNGVGDIWAPRYRQANYGAFLTDKPDGAKAIDAAYGDVALAFRAFLAANPTGPIILASHSQGSRHLLRLLKEQVAGTPVAARIAAAYAVGTSFSVEADLPALGLPACARRDQANCIVSWQSYAEPADPSPVIERFEKSAGLTGKPRKGTHMLCTNPITGAFNGSAPASANLGTLSQRDESKAVALVVGAVPARCDTSGVLMIGDPPDLGPYTLPGNNYHVYDYALFWGNLRADAKARLAAFLKRGTKPAK